MRFFGKEIEKLVAVYLAERGVRLVMTNYYCKAGEIDLIVRDREVLAFVEVRYRRNSNYGDGVATVNKNKQRRIIRAATNYLQRHKLYDKTACRFDIIAVTGAAEYDICWIKDAFWEKW